MHIYQFYKNYYLGFSQFCLFMLKLREKLFCRSGQSFYHFQEKKSNSLVKNQVCTPHIRFVLYFGHFYHILYQKYPICDMHFLGIKHQKIKLVVVTYLESFGSSQSETCVFHAQILMAKLDFFNLTSDQPDLSQKSS